MNEKRIKQRDVIKQQFTPMLRESTLFQKYKSSYLDAFFDFARHATILSGAYCLLWYFRHSYVNILTVPLIGLLHIKTFIIFHDCGHNAYTPSSRINYALGTLLGVLLVTPFSWNYLHHTHHLTNGNTENKHNFPYNQLIFHTVAQYKRMSRFERLVQKVLVSPFLLVTIWTHLYFIFGQRLLFLAFITVNQESVHIPSFPFIMCEQLVNNVGVAVMSYLLYQYSLLWLSVAIICVWTSIATFTFINQHTFNPPYVVANNKWNMKDSGLLGSSLIQVPLLLKYFFGGIEYHHIHHMNSKIPGYNLQKYHEEVVGDPKWQISVFDDVTVLSIKECFDNLQLKLYDENQNRYVTFSDALK